MAQQYFDRMFTASFKVSNFLVSWKFADTHVIDGENEILLADTHTNQGTIQHAINAYALILDMQLQS